jgi:hypothetical protein
MPEGGAGKKAEKLERTRRVGGGTAEGTGTVRQAGTARDGQVDDKSQMLMEEVCARENLIEAYKRVVQNAGAPGVDGMSVEELMPYCRRHWARIRQELLSGEYKPQGVRRVMIPKPSGKGMRTLGIPTVVERLIQQALLQVLTWSRPLVECRGTSHESGRADLCIAEIGFNQPHRRASEACEFNVNRRIPTGTYGGVGARGGQPPPATRCPAKPGSRPLERERRCPV